MRSIKSDFDVQSDQGKSSLPGITDCLAYQEGSFRTFVKHEITQFGPFGILSFDYFY